MTLCVLQVGARALETGVWGAYYNVVINMADIKDEEFKTKVRRWRYLCDSVEVLYWRTVLWGFVWTDMEQLRGEGGGGGGLFIMLMINRVVGMEILSRGTCS